MTNVLTIHSYPSESLDNRPNWTEGVYGSKLLPCGHFLHAHSDLHHHNYTYRVHIRCPGIHLRMLQRYLHLHRGGMYECANCFCSSLHADIFSVTQGMEVVRMTGIVEYLYYTCFNIIYTREVCMSAQTVSALCADVFIVTQRMECRKL